MKVRKMILCAAPLLLLAGIAYGNFNSGSEPDYVLNAMSAVSNKMSYSFGISKCKSVQHDEVKWGIVCTSANTPTVLNFSVLPADKAPYDVATSFYLIASNEAAKKSSREGLLSLLMINIDGTADESKQLVAN